MKLLEKNLKLIIGFILGVTLTSGITVYASSIIASQITYKDGKSVEYALNDLYSKKTELVTYDMLDKTTIDGTGYDLKKLTLKNNETDKIMYLKVEADVAIQDRNDTYTIDISDLNINGILDWHVFNYTSSGVFKVASSNFTKDAISIKCDTNWGYDTKYNYDYLIVVIYE